MSKALLQQHAAKAIKEKEEQEKSHAKSIPAVQPKVIITPPVSSAPAPIAPPAPMIVNQTIVLPDNKALEELAKIKSQAERLRLENERIAAQREELTKENAALKLKYELALKEAQDNAVQEQVNVAREQARLDIEEQEQRYQLTVEKETVRRVSQENDLLKEELAKLRKDNDESKVPNEVLTEVLDDQELANIPAVPPPYEGEVGDYTVVENETNEVPDEVPVSGDAAETGKVEGSCSIS